MSQTLTRSTRVLLLGTLLAAPATAQLPEAKQIVDRYIQAVGGADAIRKNSSFHTLGKFEMPAQGMTGSVESWNAEGKLLSVVEIPGIGSIRTGYDGATAWQIHPLTGATVMSGRMLDQTKQQADLAALLTPEKYIKTLETVEKTTFDGKEAFKVKLVLHNGEEYFEFYDASNYLNIGSIRKIESAMGPIEATTTIVEYQKFGGLMVPAKMKQGAMGVEQIVTITKVEFAPVPATTFELPKEIKALTGK
ncbi:MAG: hypothetical protein ACRENP_13810 [Longimicrobiales bacterium]